MPGELVTPKVVIPAHARAEAEGKNRKEIVRLAPQVSVEPTTTLEHRVDALENMIMRLIAASSSSS